MNITFSALSTERQSAVMEIINYYVQSGTAAFPAHALPEPFFAMLLKKAEGGYPAYAVLDDGKVIGFCQLSPYSPFSSFSNTADCTYFLSPEYTGKGVGAKCLAKLVEAGKEMGIRHLISSISSENAASIRFHEKNGFRRAGELSDIGEKLGRSFGVVLMQKDI